MRHFISIEQSSKAQLQRLLATAAELDQITAGATKKLPTLRGRTIFNLFFEDSTRTRISFESAAKRLSADVLNFSAKGSSVSKGESLKDTVQTLAAMGTDAIVIRHSAAGAAERLASAGWVDSQIINAGDGAHQHPTQALLDAYTISKNFGIGNGDFQGLKVAIVGDILHSRVARSNIQFLSKMGADVTLVSAPTLLPIGASRWPVRISYDFDIDLAEYDVIMLLRIQMERMSDAFFPSEREYAKYFGFNQQRFQNIKASAIVMHPGPMNRGVEIGSVAADSAQSKVLDQVKNGVISRMAVLYELLATPQSDAERGVQNV